MSDPITTMMTARETPERQSGAGMKSGSIEHIDRRCWEAANRLDVHGVELAAT